MITLDVEGTKGDTRGRQKKKASPASKVQRIPHNFGISGVVRFFRYNTNNFLMRRNPGTICQRDRADLIFELPTSVNWQAGRALQVQLDERELFVARVTTIAAHAAPLG
jgi:hypothetical protein